MVALTVKDENALLEQLETKESCSCTFPVRYLTSVMTCIGLMMTYAQRVTLNQVIVAMVNRSAIPFDEEAVERCEDPVDGINVTSAFALEEGSLVWDEYTQGLVLSSFYWGYVTTQIPGGWLAVRVGGKWLMGLAIFIGALLTLLSPVTAEYDYRLFIALRGILGFSNGVIFPSCTSLLSKWAPPGEKNLLYNIAFIGSLLGTAVIFPLSGLICTYLGGWKSAFYIFGVLCIVWVIFWSFLVYESPAVHPRITLQEKLYIEFSLGKTKPKMHTSVPWKSLLYSKPMWALNLTQFLLAWSYYIMLTDLPTYIANILGFPIAENSLLMMLPYLTCCILSISASYVGDQLLGKGLISVSFLRRASTSAYILISSASLLAVTYVGCDRMAALMFLFVCISCLGMNAVGVEVNFTDIAPKYAGVAFSLQNTFGNIAGIVAPYAVGVLTEGMETPAQWNKVFYISAGLNILALIIYNSLMSTEVQPWNYVEDDEDSISVSSESSNSPTLHQD